MKAALALIFFACFAGTMATDARIQLLDQLAQQGQGIAQAIFGQVQQQILALAQQAFGQITSLIGSFGGRFDFDFGSLLGGLESFIAPLANQAIQSLLSGLTGFLSGSARALPEFGPIFSQFFNQIQGHLVGIGQHLLNQGLASVLGGLGNLAGSRAFTDIFSNFTSQLTGVWNVAQGALSGAFGNLANLGSNILDASKPHWEQLQEQLIGHGLNALGSLSETIGNLHGTITGGR